MRSRGSDHGALAVGDERFGRLELEAPAVAGSIDLVQDLVAELVTGTADDLDFTDRMRFETALVEILGNIIEHGVPAAGRTITMHVSVQRSDRELAAVVTEDGVPAEIDLHGAQMPSGDDEDGRGLAMARALATELRYEREGTSNRWIVRCECSD